MLQAVDRKQPFTIRYRILNGKGEVRWAWDRGNGVFDDGGRLRNLNGANVDVTAQRRAEAALRESEMALAQAQRLARIGHWRWSIERRELVSCSDEFARIHRIKPEEVHALMKHQWERLIHPEDRDRFAEAFGELSEEEQDYEIEYRIIWPGGEIRHVVEIGKDSLRRVRPSCGVRRYLTGPHGAKAGRAATAELKNTS